MNDQNETKFVRRGNTIKLVNTGDQMDTLPGGVYGVNFNPFDGFHLSIQDMEGFRLPKKVYGDMWPLAERFLKTFDRRPAGTGVLLSGEKGSGKTLLTKMVANRAVEAGMPVLTVNTAYSGDEFNVFMASISQPCVVLFDEFEKTYGHDGQEGLLTLLDGVYSSKKMYLLTTNDRFKIDSHMQNRPGRVFYSLEFGNVNEATVRDYAADQLDNLSNLDSLVNFANIVKINFDTLVALVEEMNAYGETAGQAAKMMNIRVWRNESFTFTLVSQDGKRVKTFSAQGHPATIPVTKISLWVDPNGVPQTQDELNDLMDSDDFPGLNELGYRPVTAVFTSSHIVGMEDEGEVVYYDNGQFKMMAESRWHQTMASNQDELANLPMGLGGVRNDTSKVEESVDVDPVESIGRMLSKIKKARDGMRLVTASSDQFEGDGA